MAKRPTGKIIHKAKRVAIKTKRNVAVLKSSTSAGTRELDSVTAGLLPLTPECIEPSAPPIEASVPKKRELKAKTRKPHTCSWPAPKRAELEAKIKEVIELQGSHPDQDLIEDIMMTALRAVRDSVNRGELKIMAAAMREWRYAFEAFRPFSDRRKISIFGSARSEPSSPEYKAAMKFSGEMVKRGFMVISGAGPGIMEAANGGAGRDYSFGVNIRLPFEQSANPYIDGDKKLISFRYFFTRKLCFVKEASAIALFPGGFGTHDEGFEALTLIQTGKAALIPIVFIDRPGGTYWKEWAEYLEEHLLGRGLISPEDMNLFRVTDDLDWAAEHITGFYKRFHSTRWVKDRLVVRMSSPLPKKVLARLNLEFKCLLRTPQGKIVTTEALSDEYDQPELLGLSRLALPFNRRSFGKLRGLIDIINQV